MRLLKTISLFTFLMIFSGSLFATNPISPEYAAMENSAIMEYFALNDVSAEAFLDLKLKDVKEYTGKRITLKERIAFSIAKFEFRKEIKENVDADAEEFYFAQARRFSLGGFLLGFFFPIIGNLVALLFGRNAWRSSWIGTLCSLLVGIIGWAFI